ncbi:hypothetical protein PQR67_11885 [Paraburkholderia fungorum]|uniref:hypothetical protein n=1 Tax=Paraburkholderia fungorum TaxID=134537 RepID=UPI0038B89350
MTKTALKTASLRIMAAASADPTTRGARPAARVGGAISMRPAIARSVAQRLIARDASLARWLTTTVRGVACVLLVSGASALVAQTGLSTRASGLWMSALALATMTIVPLLVSRVARPRSTLATTVTLMAAMTAMGAVPAYVDGLEHSTAIAGLFVTVGAILLFYRWHLVGALTSSPEDFARNRYTNQSIDRSTGAIHATGATALLALFAGLSSGILARFQLSAICGVGAAQPIWQIALSLGVVCALAFIADCSGNNNRMLVVLYVLRATSIMGLAASDSPTAALLATKIFVVLDCLTIPALMKLRDGSHGAIGASCPGGAHHIGMILGATLSTTPYFFGTGFTVLYVLGAMANVICAYTLATKWRARKPLHKNSNHHNRRADPSDKHEVRVGRHDCLVTTAECAGTQIPDAPLPRLCGGPAYELAG